VDGLPHATLIASPVAAKPVAVTPHPATTPATPPAATPTTAPAAVPPPPVAVITVAAAAPPPRAAPPPAAQPVVAASGSSLGGAFACIRAKESGGNYATNTGNGYYGAYQFSLSTWRSVGGTGLPSEAPPAVQDALAQKLQQRSGWGQWSTAHRCGV
jgi:hypothetical protein